MLHVDGVKVVIGDGEVARGVVIEDRKGSEGVVIGHEVGGEGGDADEAGGEGGDADEEGYEGVIIGDVEDDSFETDTVCSMFEIDGFSTQ